MSFINTTATGSVGATQLVYADKSAMTDTKTVTLNVLIANYNDIIANIDKRIGSETKRIERCRQHSFSSLFAWRRL